MNSSRRIRHEFLRIDCPADLERAKASGRLGIVIGQQNSRHFRTVEDVDCFYSLGQRVSQLTYDDNPIGGGSTDPRDVGLTPLWRADRRSDEHAGNGGGYFALQRPHHAGCAARVAQAGAGDAFQLPGVGAGLAPAARPTKPSGCWRPKAA